MRREREALRWIWRGINEFTILYNKEIELPPIALDIMSHSLQ